MKLKKKSLLLILLFLPVGVFITGSRASADDNVVITDEGTQDITFQLVKPSQSQGNSGNANSGSTTNSSENALTDLFPQLNEKTGMVLLVLLLGMVSIFLSIYHLKKQQEGNKKWG